MNQIKTVFGFDMETDIGSWTSFYEGFKHGTPLILDVLKKHDIKATFFFTGDSARKNPEIVHMVRDAGHEIGCHTLFHETIGDPLFEIPGMIPLLPEEVEHQYPYSTVVELQDMDGQQIDGYGATWDAPVKDGALSCAKFHFTEGTVPEQVQMMM
ncbi:MAG: polysaccharide deacetylase family protein, partial [Lentisphaeria bacterium]|nr:polysaccharide deacetylase family protein [Lentisphaeria bacterium]